MFANVRESTILIDPFQSTTLRPEIGGPTLSDSTVIVTDNRRSYSRVQLSHPVSVPPLPSLSPPTFPSKDPRYLFPRFRPSVHIVRVDIPVPSLCPCVVPSVRESTTKTRFGKKTKRLLLFLLQLLSGPFIFRTCLSYQTTTGIMRR